MSTFERPACAGSLDDSGTQRHRQTDEASPVRDPDAVDVTEGGQLLRQLDGSKHCELSFGGTLVVAKFRQPSVLPVFGSFRFPEDGAAQQAATVADVLQHVAAVRSGRNWLDGVVREVMLKDAFEFQLHHFAVSLRQPLFGFAFQFVDLSAQVTDELVLIFFSQAIAFVGFLLCLVAEPIALFVEFAVECQFEFLLLGLEVAPLLADL